MNNFPRWTLTQTGWFATLALLSMTHWIRAADFQISDLTVENGRLSLTYTRSVSGMYRLLQGGTVNDISNPIATNIPAGELGVFSVSLPDPPAAAFYRVEFFDNRADTDQDGIPDAVEPNLGLDPLKPSSRDDGVLDGERDLAGDGLGVSWKLKYGYDPLKLNSDNRGVSDVLEDPDLDGLTNGREKQAGTSPVSADTDADGWDDKSEIADGTDPANERSGPRLEGWAVTFVSFLNEPSESQPLKSQSPSVSPNGSLSGAANQAVVDPSFRITPVQDFRNSAIKSGSSGVDGPLIFPTPSQFQTQKSMIFDEARQQMVLFGSHFGANNRESPATWLWDGYDWSFQTNSVQPQRRSNYGFAYDAERGEAVLFGGNIPSVGVTNETWIWNGTNWLQATPAHSPSPRAFATMAFDGVRKQVMLFGGKYQGQGYNDTWAWDGTDWALLQPSNSPPATVGLGVDVMASDSSQKILLLSSHGDTNVSKTWLWNGTDWNSVRSETNPVVSSEGGGLAYDRVNNVFVFWGRNQTWLWEGTNWVQKFSESAPGARTGFAMAYDSIRRRIVLHGGFASYFGGLAQTWLWDGTDWSFWSGNFQLFDLRPHPDGIWNFTRIYIPSDVTVGFIQNPANTPVTWLASSNVVINGTIDLNGGTVMAPFPSLANLASGGPGGFTGGMGGLDFELSGSFAGTPGRGPGGSAPGVSFGQPSERAKGPMTYANIYLQPLIGGSGGGGGASPGPLLGRHGWNGGGGGGAIFISSSTEITVNGSIVAQGGNQAATPNGSGGAIRLQAERISGVGSLNAEIAGRIRLESYDLAFRGVARPGPITSVPLPTRTFKPTGVSLSVVSVAGKNVALPPSANPLAPDVTFKESGPISIRIQGVGLADGTPVSLRLTANEVIISATTNLSNGEATFGNIVVPKGPGTIEVSAAFPLVPD